MMGVSKAGQVYLHVVADELFTLLAGVGVEAVVAGDAVRTVLHLDVFASTEGLLALFAAKLIAHDVGGSRARAGGGERMETDMRRRNVTVTVPGALGGGGSHQTQVTPTAA